MTITVETTASLKTRYDEVGFVEGTQLLDPVPLAEVNRAIAEICRLDRPEVVHENATDAVRAVHGCHLFDDTCARLVRHPALLELARVLLGEPVYVYQFKVNMKQPREGAAWPWHQDFAFWSREDGMVEDRAVNIAVFLDEVHAANGPLCYIPGSHRFGLLDEAGATRSGDWRNHVSADLEYTVPDSTVEALADRYGIESALGPAGAIQAFHPTIVHSSSNNHSPDPRAVLLVTYNAVSNAPATLVRPEFLVSRDTAALLPEPWESM
jgi:ectoine hydroxylase